MRKAHLVGLVTGLALVTAPAAQAATDSQSFPTDPAGWTSSSSTTGLCIAQLLCPATGSSYAGSGGTGGDADGYLRTTFSSLANTLLGTTTATWESPAFAYNGIDGQRPSTVSVDLNRRAQLASLLPVDVANTSSFRVDLVDQTAGTAVTAVDTTTLPKDAGWTAVPTVAVSPDVLTIGHQYSLRVSTTYASVATVTASGEVGYDDVRVSATRVTTDVTPTPGPPVIIYPNPGPTPPTAVLPAVTGFKSTRELRQYVRATGMPNKAKLSGNRIKLKVSCSPLAAPKLCKYAVQGLSDGRGSVPSTGRTVKSVQPGQTRIITLKVRPAFAKKVGGAKKISIRAKVRVGVFKVTVVKRVRLR